METEKFIIKNIENRCYLEFGNKFKNDKSGTIYFSKIEFNDGYIEVTDEDVCFEIKTLLSDLLNIGDEISFVYESDEYFSSISFLFNISHIIINNEYYNCSVTFNGNPLKVMLRTNSK